LSDNERKHHAAASMDIADAIKLYGVRVESELDVVAGVAAASAAASSEGHTAPAGSASPPPGYPRMFSLEDVLTHWNPDSVVVPSSYGRFSSLRVFDYEVS
jgi:hypothetical protein